MIVQAGDDGPARGVVDLLAGQRRSRSARATSTIRSSDADVDGAPVKQRRPLDQHEARRFSVISRSTAALSAPSSDAGAEGCGVAVQWVSSVRDSSAYVAATADIDISISSPPPRAQRLRDRDRGVQARQWIGDRVTAEDRGVVAAADQSTRNRGVVAERHPVGALPSVPWPVIRSQIRPSRGGTLAGPRPRRVNAAGREDSITTSAAASNACKPVGSSKSAMYESFPLFIQSKNAAGPARAPSGRAAALDLDDGRARPRQQLSAQRARPHRGQVGDEETRWAARCRRRAEGVDPAAVRPASRRARRPEGRAGVPAR